MKKKVLALVTALTVLAMGSVSVMAASPTVGTTEAPVSTQTTTTEIAPVATPAAYAEVTAVSEGYRVEAVSNTTLAATTVAVQNSLLNRVAEIGTALGNTEIANAATDTTKKVEATVLTAVEVDPTTAVKNAAGLYEVTLAVPTIGAGDALIVLHYNGTAWETIVPSAVANGALTFATASLSPVSVVKLDVVTVKESPKTGGTVPAAAAVAVIGLAGAAICTKKYSA